MLVDDDPIFRLLVGRVAKQLGHAPALLMCANLAETAAVKEQTQFWVVDVNLPDGQGPDWVEQQRVLGFKQEVLLLSNADYGKVGPALQPCQFLPKPNTLEGLRELMQGWWT